MILRTSAFAAAFSVMLLGTSVWAVPIAVTNHSFEDPGISAGGNAWSDVNLNWGDDVGTSGAEFTERNDAVGFTNGDGEVYSGVQDSAELVQDLADSYQAGGVYKLTVAVGNRAGFTADGDFTSIELRDSTDTVLASTLVNAGLVAAGTFADFSTTYVASGTEGAIRIGLNNLGAGGGQRSHFDNVRLNLIPEPSAILLLGLGLLGVAARTWRRRP